MTEIESHTSDQGTSNNPMNSRLESETQTSSPEFDNKNITIHRDIHVDSEYQHVTLVTEQFVAVFHRNRDELATLLADNLTPRTTDIPKDELIEKALSIAEGTVAPIIKYGEPVQNAVRWGCLHCDEIYANNSSDVSSPCSCPDCDTLLVREGSSMWLAHDGFPNQTIHQ